MTAGTHRPRPRRRGVAVLATLALLAGLGLTQVSSAAAEAGDFHPVPPGRVWTVDGRGYGHGHGLSQWGAQGAALSGRSTSQIIGFYYPGTQPRSIGNPELRVQLTKTASSAVQLEAGLPVEIVDQASGAGTKAAPGGYRVLTAGSRQSVQQWNGSGWVPLTLGGSGSYAGPLSFATADGVSVYATDGTARNYRGHVRVTRTADTSSVAVNFVRMEDYLRGVVPRESPAFFEAAALGAQAIAARSYSHWDSQTGAAAWDICDTDACQVYWGRSTRSTSGTWTAVENPRTDAAIAATAGTALYYDNSPAFTQFSASNGGVASAGSRPYLAAFADPFDGVDGRNTSHRWTTTLSAAYLEAKYPQVGTLQGIRITGREGLGEWGGYISSLQLVGTASTISVSPRLNLKSTWWQPRNENAPYGNLEAFSVSEQTVTVGGWTFDPNQPTTPLQVHVYVDGVGRAILNANGQRPDVAAAFPFAGAAHGFSGSLVVPPGRHDVCLYAINTGPGANLTLSCRTVVIEDPAVHNPVGSMDAVQVAGSTVTAAGWTLDPDAPTATVAVHVYVDGRGVGSVPANESRPDIGRAFPSAGDLHGFRWSGTLAVGPHTVCAYAINQDRGSGNPPLGCRTITIAPPPSPIGSLDGVTVSGATVTAGGWTLDPDAAAAVLAVHVYVDGQGVASLPADLARPDIGRAFPAAGPLHGFAWSATLSTGSHQVCVYAINQGPAAANTVLGCRSVTVSGPRPDAGNPVGSLDGVQVSGTTVTAGGWSLDPDVPTATVSVHVHVDGRPVAGVAADGSRPDIGRAFPAAGDQHGYSWAGTLSTGSHQVCAYAINQGAGTTNPQLGCRTVRVG